MNISKILEWVYTAKPELRNRTITDIEAKDIFLVNALINEEYIEAREAIYNGNKQEFIDAIVDSIWMTLNYAAMGGITANEILAYAEKVQESNDSKFCDNEEDAAHTVNLYNTGMHPDKISYTIETYWKKVGSKYVIFRKEDNKIMKSYKYKSLNNEN